MKKAAYFSRTFLIKGIIIFIATSSIFTGCTQDPNEEPVPSISKNKTQPESFKADAKPDASVAAKNFVAPLSGEQEVPSADTKATGNAVFQLKGEELHYRLIVANIQNVTMAHIHLAPAGENGAVVAWLYPSGPPPQLIPGRTSGILATGVITTADLTGPLGMGVGTLEDLLEAMRTGDAYVNVHTSQFPAGEIRGQIKAAGRK